MTKTIQEISLHATPPHLERCFELVSRAGATAFALFGGAVRDTDYAAHHNLSRPIKDYDVRVWLPPEEHQARTQLFLARLSCGAASNIREVPAGGTPHRRYCLSFDGTEMDVSIRARETDQTPLTAVAIDRAEDADIGLSSIAIAPDASAWGAPEYLQDRDNRTLSVYPDPNVGRLTEYTERMLAKYPDHTVVYLDER